jgi:hypothetical protein
MSNLPSLEKCQIYSRVAAVLQPPTSGVPNTTGIGGSAVIENP